MTKIVPAIAGAVVACAFPLTVSCTGAPPASADLSPPEHVRLYTLDCGRIEIADIGSFSDTGHSVGRAHTMADPCFLIRHPKGTLLWDTGLNESIGRSKEGNPNPVGREFVDVSLRDQLKTLSLRPSDITFVGFSHLHADHAGNANLFASSTWLLNRRELESALQTPPPIGVDPSTFSEYRHAKVSALDGDFDVFGDGSVRILATPGHTPGHQSLTVRLERAGTVILSGDLAHTTENWRDHVVPSFNADREATRTSMGRIEQLVRETHARFVVQHAEKDVHALPSLPAYLD